MKKIIYFLLFLSTSYPVLSQKAGNDEIHLVLQNFLLQNKMELLTEKSALSPVLSVNNSDTIAYVFDFENAFVVISAQKKFPPIKAFSFNGKFDFSDIEYSLLNLLKSDYEQNSSNSSFLIKNTNDWNSLSHLKSLSETTTFGPYLESLFGQANCKDQNGSYINVTNTHTPNNWSVGCVALTQTTLMHYYNWPVHGVGSYSYHDNGSNKDLSADFENTHYKWGDILDEYNGVTSTTSQRNALGELAFQSAVALDMYFTSSGSTSNVNKLARVGNQYFRYSGHYESTSHPGFFEMLIRNLKQEQPVQLAVSNSGGAGHAVVCDGLMQNDGTNYYHLNMGWWGNSNAWYNIENGFYAGGYTIINGGVFDMLPEPELNDIDIQPSENTTVLSWEYQGLAEVDTFELQVKRDTCNWISLSNSITSKDFKVYINDYSYYKYRVRAKNSGKWEIESWSQIKELSRINTLIEQVNTKPFIKIYPQPASEEINIDAGVQLNNSSIMIYDLNGKLIYKTIIQGAVQSVKIDTQNWKKGIYVLKINVEKGSLTKKISIM